MIGPSGLEHLACPSHVKTRSISPENPTGGKGEGGMATTGTGARHARDLGHVQFRRVNPLPCKSVYTIPDGVQGWGHYVGTYMAWGANHSGRWGEGEVKFYIDGDDAFPTICGTGTEDYFCGSYDFDLGPEHGGYTEFSTPYSRFHVIRPDGLYQSQTRFALYRWHIVDPIRFEQDLRVTIQALGWRSRGRYLPRQDNIASVAYCYQTLPAAPFPPLPDRDTLEII